MSYANGSYQLLTNQSSIASGNAVDWPGGRGVFSATGDAGGSTTKMQHSPDDGNTWIDVDRAGDTFVTFTTLPAAGGFELPPCKIRADVSGGTPSGISAFAASSRS